LCCCVVVFFLFLFFCVLFSSVLVVLGIAIINCMNQVLMQLYLYLKVE
jgi:hypothetical protein